MSFVTFRPGVVALALAASAAVATAQTPVEPGVDRAVAAMLAAPAVQRVMEAVKADHPRSLQDLKLLTEIPAPPFKEKVRAEAFLARLKAVGLKDATIDAEGNVIGIRKGSGGGPKLLVSAHLDTVFPEGTDVTIQVRDGKWYAPGIGDDTSGLATLLSWVKVLDEAQLETVADLMIVGNVGEEELGNLRGMKALFRDHPDIDGMVGLEPGNGEAVITIGVGSHRHEVTFKGPGGHSYEAFGRVPSAIHAMGRAIAKIAEVRPAQEPKTTFTVGTVGGGTSVNTIAPEARMAIDIRSVGNAQLLDAERQIMAAIQESVVEENRRWGTTSMTVSTKVIGDRPGGRTAPDARIVQVAVRATTAMGLAAPAQVSASTDANVPMSLGIPAVIMGSGGKSGGWHTRAEWYDPTDAWQGSQASLAAVLALAGVKGVSEPLLAKRAK